MRSARIRKIAFRVPILLFAAAVLAATAFTVFNTPAFAQDRDYYGPWSLRNLLFPRRNEFPEPPPPPRPKAKAKVRKAAPAEPKVAIAEKAADARTVLVVGDFMASGLAEGLDAVFAENPAIRIADLGKGSSGLVRDDVYDWPGGVKALIEAEKPAVVLVMVGSNDRQQMKAGDTREPPRSAAWTKEYETRAEALGEAIASTKVPYLWVGMPAFRVGNMTSDMLAFNDIYRSAAETAGGEFVDVWDGFVDEDGVFVSTGPDVNGQPVRLRSDDGINMTRAGKRKLAFYAEKPLMKLLGISAPAGAATALPEISPTGKPAEPFVPAAVDRTPPISLNDPALDGGAELLGAEPAGKTEQPSPARKLAENPLPGRADDFSWPPRQAPARTAATSGDRTTAIRR